MEFQTLRSPGWGRKRTQKERVEWHELKTGVFYRHEQAGVTEGRRGIIFDKRMVRWLGEPVEFGRRLNRKPCAEGASGPKKFWPWPMEGLGFGL